MPKTRFNPTATGATDSVRKIEVRVSESPTRFLQYAAGPFAKACTKTFTSGTTTKNPMTATAVAMSILRTHGGSSWARGGTGSCSAMALAPPFEEVDAEERDERAGGDDDRGRGRLRGGG